MNVAEILTRAAPHYGGKPLLRFRGGSIGHDALVGRADALTGALMARGLGPDGRMLLLAQNSPEWLVSLFAGLRVGAMVVPVNPALTASEIGYIVTHARPAMVVVDAGLESLLPEARPFEVLTIAEDGAGSWHRALSEAVPTGYCLTRGADDSALMFYTSGTTGRPKGAILGHGAETFTAALVSRHFRLGPGDVSLIASPLTFIYPLVIDFLSSVMAGATVVLHERFHPEHVVRAVEAERATLFMGVPTMYGMILDWATGRDADLSSLRFAISAGQNLPWSVAERFRDRFGVPVYDLWGLTEGTPITGYDPATEPQGRPESCGRALPGCAVRVVGDDGRDLDPGAVGEVLLRGPNVFLGYFENLAATAEMIRDGWVHTGDLGRLDAEGYLFIVGRKKDLVIRGGANIYPSEVEEVMYRHPDVQDCTVIGVPDPIYGERVKAFVVPVRDRMPDAEAILAHCRVHLAGYKVPGELTFLDALPVGPTGKVLKRLLRDREARG